MNKVELRTDNETEKTEYLSIPLCYEPEKWTVLKDHVYGAIRALQSGLEYAKECASTHELNLGRTTYKNRVWAEQIDSDICKMQKALSDLKSYRSPFCEETI